MCCDPYFLWLISPDRISTYRGIPHIATLRLLTFINPVLFVLISIFEGVVS